MNIYGDDDDDDDDHIDCTYSHHTHLYV